MTTNAARKADADPGPSATTEPPWGWGSEDKYADMKAAYLARDARLIGLAALDLLLQRVQLLRFLGVQRPAGHAEHQRHEGCRDCEMPHGS